MQISGQTIHTKWGQIFNLDNKFYFADGMSYAFVSFWGKATLLMVNASVIPLWPYQSTNLAHKSSYFLAVNSYTVDAMVDIYGSAWIGAGSFNPVAFQV